MEKKFQKSWIGREKLSRNLSREIHQSVVEKNCKNFQWDMRKKYCYYRHIVTRRNHDSPIDHMKISLNSSINRGIISQNFSIECRREKNHENVQFDAMGKS